VSKKDNQRQLTPTVLALIPVMHIDANPQNGITLKGILNARGFEKYPVDIHTMSIVTIWYGVDKGFEQSIKLVDPNGNTISLQSITLQRKPNAHYVISQMPIESSLPEPGIYRIELYSSNVLRMIKPFQFLSPPGGIISTLHEPYLSALVVAENVSNRENLEETILSGIMTEKGISRGKALTIVTVWENAKKTFSANFELSRPDGTLLDKRPFHIEVNTVRNIGCVMCLDLPTTAFRHTGNYQLKVSYNDKNQEFPIFIK
jgi:hypothetical protein